MSIYESIVQGLNEAIDYEKGCGEARTAKCNVILKESSASTDNTTILEESTTNKLQNHEPKSN